MEGLRIAGKAVNTILELKLFFKLINTTIKNPTREKSSLMLINNRLKLFLWAAVSSGGLSPALSSS